MTRFIRELVWGGRPPGEVTVIAYVLGTEDVFGFGSWKHVEITLEDSAEPMLAIRIPYFGVDKRFQGEKDESGHTWAGRLYVSLEALALRDPDSTPGMPIELFCDEENDRGRNFWERRGFVDIGAREGTTYRRMVKRSE